MKKTRRKELFKTASLYLVLFSAVSMVTSGLGMPSVSAHPTDCDLELNDPDTGFIYAKGVNLGESYTIYGIKADSKITNRMICGHFQTDGSVVGSIVAVVNVGGKFIELGWFKGNYTDAEPNMIALSTPHYFRGFKDSGGDIQYLDISDDQSTYPSVNTWSNFTLNGDISGGYNWNSTIENSGHSTIVITGATMPSNSGTSLQVFLESHNNKSLISTYFKNIKNGKIVSSVLTWEPWSSSANTTWIPPAYPDSWNPYYSSKISVDEFCMWTIPGSCP